MTKDELKILKKDLELRENEIKNEMGALSKEQHEIHVKMRDYYKQYVDEHFPYKVGDKLKYTFSNNQGDKITREIEISEISTYRCNLSEIILFYKWNNELMRIDDVNIDGEISSILNEKIEKLN